MTDNSNHPIEVIAQSVVDDATHYIDSVSAMAVGNDLSFTEDIVSSTGVKLVAHGTRINAHLREMLCGHHLSGTALDKSLSVTGGITPETLAIDIEHLIHKDTWLKQLISKSGDSGAMRHDVSSLKLPREILFRLTLARDQRPALYRHSLSVAIIGYYLSLRLHLGQMSINNLLIAALCHDLGELYVDPAILDSGHRVTNEERRFIYVHPIVGWMIAREIPSIGSEVSNAILQHQERLDGSGYPHGKKNEDLGLPGRVLAIADVSASVMARFSDHRRLSTLLRLNNKKYDSRVIALLHDAILQEETAPGHVECGATIMSRLSCFASVLDGWTKLQDATEIAQEIPCEFIFERMFNLRMVMLQFGFDPDSLDMLLKLAEEDKSIAAEMTAVVDELQFQLAELGREFDRHAVWLDNINPLIAAALTDWRKQLQDCLES